jgi:hypothetical protein
VANICNTTTQEAERERHLDSGVVASICRATVLFDDPIGHHTHTVGTLQLDNEERLEFGAAKDGIYKDCCKLERLSSSDAVQTNH